MPVTAVIVANAPNEIDDATLSRLRADLVEQLGIDQEDFYYHQPLVRVPPEDYELVHSARPLGCLISVELNHRYYGVGYEGGHLPTFVSIAEWLEQQMPGCEVLYGHDVNQEVYPFGPAERAKLVAYWDKVGNEPYHDKTLTPEQKEQYRALYDQ